MKSISSPNYFTHVALATEIPALTLLITDFPKTRLGEVTIQTAETRCLDWESAPGQRLVLIGADGAHEAVPLGHSVAEILLFFSPPLEYLIRIRDQHDTTPTHLDIFRVTFDAASDVSTRLKRCSSALFSDPEEEASARLTAALEPLGAQNLTISAEAFFEASQPQDTAACGGVQITASFWLPTK